MPLIERIQKFAPTTRKVAEYTRLIQNSHQSLTASDDCVHNFDSFYDVSPDEVFWVKINFVNINKFIIYPFRSEGFPFLPAFTMVYTGPHFVSDRAIHNIPKDDLVPYYISSKDI